MQDDDTHRESPVLEGSRSTKKGEGGKTADTEKKNDDSSNSKDKTGSIDISAILFGLSFPSIANAPRTDSGNSSAASAGTPSGSVKEANSAGMAAATNAHFAASALPNAERAPMSAKPALSPLPKVQGEASRFSESIGAPPTNTSGAPADCEASAAQPSSSVKIADVTVATSAILPPSGTQADGPEPADTKSDKMPSTSANGMDGSADSSNGSTEAGNLAASVAPARSPGRNAEGRGNSGSNGQDGGGNSGKPSLSGLHATSPQAGAAGSTAFGSTGAAAGPLLGQTASSFVSGMESAQPWASSVTQAAYMANQPIMGMPVRSLSIALQPAALGSVTANLHLSGQQLRIEVEVGTEEARQRLSSDADDIVKSLRSLGFDVSHITIKHGGNAIPATMGANQTAGLGQGNTPFQASTNSGGGSGGGAARSNAGNNNGDNAHASTSQPTGGDGGSRGLYI